MHLSIHGYGLMSICLMAGACSAGEERCKAGTDCASGVCLPGGRCHAEEPDGGQDQPDGAVLSDAPASGCQPDHDGWITRQEVPLRPGLQATFRIALDATVSTAGQDQGGLRTWDLSGQLAGDADSDVVLEPLEGKWFAPTFPSASYATRLSAEEALLGVFEITDDALLLRGIVSPQDGAGRTELTYDPPVRVLAFPVGSGETWSTSAQVTGLAQGIFSTYTEDYEQFAGVRGEVMTPFGTFPVLRVRVELTRTIGFATTRVRSYLFVSECFGTVASIRSQDNEPQIEFTDAAEIRRLAP